MDRRPGFYDESFFQAALEAGLRVGDVAVRRVELGAGAAGGENYCSNLYRARVAYRRTGSEDEAEHVVALIVKNLPAEKQGVLRHLDVYNKETIFYLDVKPRLEALMWQVVAPPSTPWQLGAKHFVSTTRPEPTIVLEDLTERGFAVRSRQEGLDEAQARLVLHKLAQYHALTMVMARKDPEKVVVERFPFGLLNTASIQAPPFEDLFGAQLLKLASVAATWPGFEGICAKLRRYHQEFAARVHDAVYPLEGAINVLNHGDLWVNNLLFSEGESGFDDGDDEARDGVEDERSEREATGRRRRPEVRLIDFQLCFVGSPGFDVNYFLNTSLRPEVLRSRRDALVDRYARTLAATLAAFPTHRHGLPGDLLEAVRAEVRSKEAYGFFVAFAFLPLMAMAATDSADNSLASFHDADFAARKIELMFRAEGRLLETLKHVLRRADRLGVLD